MMKVIYIYQNILLSHKMEKYRAVCGTVFGRILKNLKIFSKGGFCDV